MKSIKLNFSNQEGIQLSGRLELPIGRPIAYALFAHCFTCNKNFNAVKNISRSLNAKGIAVFRFDFTGLGDSEGEFANTNFSSNTHDLVAAYQFLEKEHVAPGLIIGHSLGGAAVLSAVHYMPLVKAVVTIGAPYSPDHVTHLFDDQVEEIKKTGKANVNIGGRPFVIKNDFLEDVAEVNAFKNVHELNRALLVMHSPSDNIVGLNNAAEIYKAAQHPKNYISLDGADHLLSKREDSLFASEIIAAWSKKYLDLRQEIELKSNNQVATSTGKEGYTTDIKAGSHRLVADEPIDVGGEDLGPTPYDLLLSSLGACTGMTLRMYASRKKWPLDMVRVHLDHKKDHASDCASCEQGNSLIDKIDRRIELQGDLDETQKKRLLEIADKCPVHKTLHNQIEVTTQLVDSE